MRLLAIRNQVFVAYSGDNSERIQNVKVIEVVGMDGGDFSDQTVWQLAKLPEGYEITGVPPADAGKEE